MNWGYRIFFLYVAFVGFILFFVIRSSFYDFHLVTKSYYEEGIAYDQQHKKIENTRQLNQDIQISVHAEEQYLSVQIPSTDSMVEGHIHFYRPSDSNLDFILPIQSSYLEVETNTLKPGYWKIKINWSEKDMSYYHEESVMII